MNQPDTEGGAGSEVGGGLFESVLDVFEVVGFFAGGFGEVDEVAVGGEIAFFDDGGGGDFKIYIAEEGGVVFVGEVGFGVGEGGGEADDDGVGDLTDEVAQDDSPVVEEVVAFVEDDGADAVGEEVLDELVGVGVEEVGDIYVIAAEEVMFEAEGAVVAFAGVGGGVVLADGFDAGEGVSGGFDLAFFDEVVGPFLEGHVAEVILRFGGGGDELVGVDVERGKPRGVEAGVVVDLIGVIEEHAHFLPPLSLNRGGGGEDDSGVTEPRGEFDADDGFARAGGGNDVVFTIIFGILERGIHLSEDHPLVFAERVTKSERHGNQHAI